MTELLGVSVQEAVALILSEMRPCPIEIIPLTKTLGRTLAADVLASISLPPWTNASMDGYAMKADDVIGATADNPRRLHVVGRTPAGKSVTLPIVAGQAVRVFTGGEIPEGADTVVRQEDISVDGEEISVLIDRDARANVRLAGGDVKIGMHVFTAGTLITTKHIAMMSALGMSEAQVHIRPRIGILVTGDEVIPAEDSARMASGQFLADVNGPMLQTLVTEAGALPIRLGISPDNPTTISQIVSAAPALDLLITAGGVSVGDHDHLPAVMRSLGAEFRFRRVRVRPGGPTTFGVLPSGTPWLGLPGNPVSSFVIFMLLGGPAVRALSGCTTPIASTRVVTNGESIRQDKLLELYLRVKLIGPGDGSAPIAIQTGPQGSGILSSIATADALLRVPAGDGLLHAGELLEAIPID